MRPIGLVFGPRQGRPRRDIAKLSEDRDETVIISAVFPETETLRPRPLAYPRLLNFKFEVALPRHPQRTVNKSPSTSRRRARTVLWLTLRMRATRDADRCPLFQLLQPFTRLIAFSLCCLQSSFQLAHLLCRTNHVLHTSIQHQEITMHQAVTGITIIIVVVIVVVVIIIIVVVIIIVLINL